MAASHSLVVFDALMLRCLALNDNSRFLNEMAAFRAAFQNRRFRILLTDGILNEYLVESNNPPQFQPLPILNSLSRDGRAIRLDEYRLNRFSIQLTGLPQEHRDFIYDAIAARANYLITARPAWLDLSEQAENNYGLQILTPGGFAELEG